MESLPHCYLNEGGIQRCEVSRASAAFREGREPEPYDPYVERWDYTLADDPVTEMLVGYRLDDFFYHYWRSDRRVLSFGEPDGRGFTEFMDLQRSLRKSDPKSDKSIFIDNASRWLEGAGVVIKDFDHKAWARWVYDDPKRCPALMLQFQVLREIVRNVADVPKESDVPDLAYVPAVPYVDTTTMDKRMANYTKQAARVLSRRNRDIAYDKSLFKDIGTLLNS